jgi:NAD(P)-dependent dehydrogenase (short-subunit alcohol dehydrogenase family)
MSEFAGRVAVVTGAARGIGRATALRLAAGGARVALVDLAGTGELDTVPYPLSTTEDLAGTAEAIGAEAVIAPADVRDGAAVRAAIDQVFAECGRIDILAHCAGISSFASLLEMDDRTWDEMIAVNLTGGANAIRAVAPAMVDAGYGRIVLIGSIAGRRGSPLIAHYAAAKWGVHGLAKSASLELFQHGITVNVVNPGPVNTVISDNDGVREYARRLSTTASTESGPPPLAPEVIADTIAHLAREDSRHISGGAVDVSDGRNAILTA